MTHRIIVAVLDKNGENPKQVYEQLVEDLNLKAVIEAANRAGPALTFPHAPVAETPRKRRERSDKGKPRQPRVIGPLPPLNL